MKKLNLTLCKSIWKITRCYWHSTEKWYAGMLLGIIITLQMSDIYILVLYNQWQNTFYNTIQNLDKSAFLSSLGYWPVFTVAFLVIDIYKLYLLQLLEIKWRSWLTNHYLQEWLQNRTYYIMQMIDHRTDNPDQRISEDIRLFVSALLDLSLGLLRAIVTFCSFSSILWMLSGELTLPFGTEELHIPGYMVWVAIIYAGVGSFFTIRLGNPLVQLTYDQQRYEADFRFSLMRLRENSEGIAFYKGEQREQSYFMKQFNLVTENFRGLMKRQKNLSWLTLAHWRLSFLFPYMIAAPRLFTGQMQLGGLFQTSTAFTQVESALTFFMRWFYSLNGSSLAELQAVVNRLIDFIDTLEQINFLSKNSSIEINDTTASNLLIHALDVELPNGTLLLQDLNLEIQAGDTLLITGDFGCGKSSLMKTLAGIWPFGQGIIDIPKNQNTLFLPQTPYLPIGTLREVLLYPTTNTPADDKRIREVMFMCQLGQFVDQLDQSEHWSHILSHGEQQCIAFARAILQQPHWIFLDEATSALDEMTERILYRLLQDQLHDSAIISVGHRSTLIDYHTKILHIGNAGTWTLAA